LSDINNATTISTGKNSWQIVAVIFGFAAPLGYGAAYLREWGFCIVFGIPTEFIQLNITTILITITSGLGFLLFFYWIAENFYKLTKQERLKTSPMGYRVVFSILGFMFLSYFLVFFPSLTDIWLLIAGFFVLMIAIMFVVPLYTQRKIHGYINKLEAQDRTTRETPMLLDHLVKSNTGAIIFVVIIFVILFLGGMFLNGYNMARGQTDFLVPSTHQDSIVLRIYGNNLICAPLNGKTKEVEKSFFIIKLDDEPRPQLNLMKLGPLKSPKIWTLNSQD
jgi:hypothetical protein